MKRKITFKTWLYVFFGGIGQFFRNIFSWKNKTPFWRVIWAVIAICILAFTCMMGYAFYREFSRDIFGSPYYDDYYDSKLSNDYSYHSSSYKRGQSYIYNSETKKKVIKNIDWVAVALDGDSLVVVAKKGKRGFINRFTGQIAIPFQYDGAWIFSDGVAAVCEGDSVYFIDHSGKPINNKRFPRMNNYNSYTYHGNLAAIPIDGKFGLIDRSGNWKLLPEYEDIHIGSRNMWVIKNNNKVGVIDTAANFIVPIEYDGAMIYPEEGIVLAEKNNFKTRVDYEGNVTDKFVFDEIYEMGYYINDFDEEGNQKQAIDETMVKYSCGSDYGLMTRSGNIVTLPLYKDISAVAPGVYECQIGGVYDSILINSKGEKINR